MIFQQKCPNGFEACQIRKNELEEKRKKLAEERAIEIEKLKQPSLIQQQEIELKKEIMKEKEELQKLQEEYNDCWRRQSLAGMNSDKIIYDYLETWRNQQKEHVDQLLSLHGYDCTRESFSSILQSISSTIESLQKDIDRVSNERLETVAKVSKEEGKQALLESQKESLQQTINQLEEEVKMECQAYQIEYSPSLDVFYSMISYLQSKHSAVVPSSIKLLIDFYSIIHYFSFSVSSSSTTRTNNINRTTITSIIKFDPRSS